MSHKIIHTSSYPAVFQETIGFEYFILFTVLLIYLELIQLSQTQNDTFFATVLARCLSWIITYWARKFTLIFIQFASGKSGQDSRTSVTTIDVSIMNNVSANQ